MPIAALDLFCGIGGLTHGLQLSGIPVIAGFDIDDSCRYAYEANNASEFVVADVAHLQGQDLLDYYPVNTTKILVGCAPCQPFSKYTQRYRKEGHTGNKWRLLDSFARLVHELHPEMVSMENVPELSGQSVFHDFVRALEAEHCYKIVILLERFMKFISNSSDVYFRRITFTDGVRPAAFFYCKSVSEKSSGGMDVFYHDFNVMKYVPKIIENLAKELGNRITESVTLGHIENYESMFTPQRFIEQIMAFEYLFEKLEPEKAEQRNFHLIDELELMLGVFPDVIAGVRKSTRKIADEIKNLRVDIVHGHAYYYDFANDHNIQYYMLMLDKLIERMNLKLVGFNDEEIKTFCSY